MENVLGRIAYGGSVDSGFDAGGAYRFGDRWSSVETRLAYTAEYFIHIDPDDPPKGLMVVTTEIPDDVSRLSISRRQLPAYWRQSPSPQELAGIGDKFAGDRRAAIVIVPSALAPAVFCRSLRVRFTVLQIMVRVIKLGSEPLENLHRIRFCLRFWPKSTG